MASNTAGLKEEDDEESLTPKQVRVLKAAVVTAISAREDIPIVVDNSKGTSCTDLKTIWVTKQNIPKQLRAHKDVSFSLYKSLVGHELGHILWTTSLNDEYKAWQAKRYNCQLAHLVMNIIEDKRIDTRLMAEYRHGVGANLRDFNNVSALSYMYTLRKEFGQMKAEGKLAKGVPPDKELINTFILYYSVYEAGPAIEALIKDFFPNLPKEWHDDMVRGAGVVNLCRFYNRWKFQLELAATDLFQIMKKYAPDGREGSPPPGGEPIDGHGPAGEPGGEGGRIVKGGGKDPGNWPGRYGNKPVDLPPELEPQPTPPGPPPPKGARGQGAGSGTGETISTPTPDEFKYNQRRNRLASIIQRMRNMLKSESRPKYEQERWKPQGRMMQGVLAGAYIQARRQPVTNVYVKNIMRYEKSDVTLALLVDLSGSTDTELMADVLTIIAEVSGNWLSDEKWGMFTFGSGFQKIKTFWESYNNTKARIGGLEDMGGTYMAGPLGEIGQMFKKVKDASDKKVLIIVSDFQLMDDDYPASRVQINRMKKLSDVETICIVNDRSEAAMQVAMQNAKKLSDHVVPMPDISKLPENFFKVYKSLAYTGLKGYLSRKLP